MGTPHLWKQVKGNPRCYLLIPPPVLPRPPQVEVTESSNQDALSGSSDLLELLLQEDSRSGTGSASGSLGSGSGPGSGSGSQEGGSTSASITRECPSSSTSCGGTVMGVGRPGLALFLRLVG